MKKYNIITMLFSFCIVTGCAMQPGESNEHVIAEAQAFMEGYAQDLRAKNGTAVAARYNRSGFHSMGFGHKKFTPYDSVRVSYEERWRGPDSFEWQNLSFEPITSDAIMVLGQFLWGNDNIAEPMTFSYTGLLVRQDGELRIRVEDESGDPMSMKGMICPPDSTTE